MSYYYDVGAFHEKFALPRADGSVPPRPLTADLVRYRGAFMLEELIEWFEAQGAFGVASHLCEIMEDLKADTLLTDAPMHGMADSADALVDLCYVALGTAHLSGLDFDAHWAEVQRANMSKERGRTAKRDHDLDVCKPEGWVGPDHEAILARRR